MASSAVMNPAYYLSSSPRQSNPVRQTRDSLDSNYSLVKPIENAPSKNKAFLGIFTKDKNSKKTQATSTSKIRETNIHDIAHGTSAWK